MPDNPNKHVEEKMQEISKTLASALKGHIGQPSTRETRQKLVEQAFSAALGNHPALAESSARVTSCRTAWQSMVWKNKLLWFLCNMVAPVIGSTVRSLHADAMTYREHLSSGRLASALEDPVLPPWAVRYPRSVMVVTVVMQAPPPGDTF